VAYDTTFIQIGYRLAISIEVPVCPQASSDFESPPSILDLNQAAQVLEPDSIWLKQLGSPVFGLE